MRAAYRFPTSGKLLGRQNRSDCLHSPVKACSKLFGVHTRKDAVKGIMRGNTIGQVEECLQPRSFRLLELLHIYPRTGSADHHTQRYRGDIEQLMPLRMFYS